MLRSPVGTTTTITIALVLVLALTVTLVVAITMSTRSKRSAPSEAATATNTKITNALALKRDVEDWVAADAFGIAENDDSLSAGPKVERRREAQRDLLGPLAPVDCATTQAICVTASNCNLLCKNAALVSFDCVNGACVEKAVSNVSPSSSSSSSDDQANCNTRIGEYGLLVGYNELGVAQWECVQLYPRWQNLATYCEGGTVSLDARVREPSYRDCSCAVGHTRMVYRRSVLGQTAHGLPHCVRDDLVRFYEPSYEKL